MQSEVESQIKDCFILLERKLTQIHMKLNSLDARVESVENTTTFLREKIRNFSFQTSEMECPKTPNRQKCEVLEVISYQGFFRPNFHCFSLRSQQHIQFWNRTIAILSMSLLNLMIASCLVNFICKGKLIFFQNKN